jgi:septal ring factor EnvC (AmiA/AmiB activator)
MRRNLLTLIFLLLVSALSAQSSKVKDLENKRASILADIKVTDELLRKNKETTSNALKRIDLLIQQIHSRQQVVELLNNEISELNNEINDKEKQIALLEKEQIKKKGEYSVSLRKMYAYKRNQNKLLFILSANDFTQSYRRVLYLKKYSEWQKEKTHEILNFQSQLAAEKQTLERSKTAKKSLISAKQQEENQLNKEENRKRGEVESLKKDRKKLQSDLTLKKNKADALNKQIEKVIADEIAASQKAAAKAQASEKPDKKEERKADTQGGYAMTKEEKTVSSNFAGNKGKLPFPLKGSYKIVEYFGINQNKEIGYVKINNNGIDVETTSGNEARAVFDGIVSSVFTIPDYNYSIIVRHGNYLTLYANLESVYVKQGDKVKTGQSLGKIYTNRDNATLLHFEIRKEQAKLNPMDWLNK